MVLREAQGLTQRTEVRESSSWGWWEAAALHLGQGVLESESEALSAVPGKVKAPCSDSKEKCTVLRASRV